MPGLASGVQFPDQGLNLGPLKWECRVLATRRPGKFLRLTTFIVRVSLSMKCCLKNVLDSLLVMINYRAPQVVLVVKNPPANAGDTRDESLIPKSGRSFGEGNGNPVQYSCLENPMDRGAWQAIVHVVEKSQT